MCSEKSVRKSPNLKCVSAIVTDIKVNPEAACSMPIMHLPLLSFLSAFTPA